MSKIKIPELKRCPICGGTAVFKKVNVYGQDAYQVECRLCHLTIRPVLAGRSGLFGTSHVCHITITDAKHNAALEWNDIKVHNDLWKTTSENMLADMRKAVCHE